MDLFKPSKKVLETIAFDASSPGYDEDTGCLTSHCQYTFLPSGFSPSPVVSSTISVMQEFYSSRAVPQVCGSLVNEALKNGLAHGPGEGVTFGLFFGRHGACYGFMDGGDFFKDSETKRLFENKIPITDFSPEVTALDATSGAHIGVNNYIYPGSDVIEIDTDRGILYCVQLRHRLLEDE